MPGRLGPDATAEQIRQAYHAHIRQVQSLRPGANQVTRPGAGARLCDLLPELFDEEDDDDDDGDGDGPTDSR